MYKYVILANLLVLGNLYCSDSDWGDESENVFTDVNRVTTPPVSPSKSPFKTPPGSAQRHRKRIIKELNESVEQVDPSESIFYDDYNMGLISKLINVTPTTPGKKEVVKIITKASPQKLATPQRRKVSQELSATLDSPHSEPVIKLFGGFGIKVIREAHIDDRHVFEKVEDLDKVSSVKNRIKYVEMSNGVRFAFIKDKESKRGLIVEKSIFPIMKFEDNFKLLEKMNKDFLSNNIMLSLPNSERSYGIEAYLESGAIKSAFPVNVLNFESNENQAFGLNIIYESSCSFASTSASAAAVYVDNKSYEGVINLKELLAWIKLNKIKSKFKSKSLKVFEVVNFIKANSAELKDLPITRGFLAVIKKSDFNCA